MVDSFLLSAATCVVSFNARDTAMAAAIAAVYGIILGLGSVPGAFSALSASWDSARRMGVLFWQTLVSW